MSRTNIFSYLKKAAIVGILIVLALIIRNILTSILSTHDRAQILKELQNELSQKKEEQAFLSQKLYYAKTDAFVEVEARQKLGLIREGEVVVIDEKVKPLRRSIVLKSKPVWKMWWDLFF
ncbi:MAG: septum formation initiator family protein [Candidatus Levybacteria bacterium]|nr:septum formation initiator family protein [Candidatus Levybacteria bacterium]MBP9815113.1 septum formation initiator family protein [Candidatus Levybacteria bacterium]